jgi:hypothetical protein
VGIRPWLILQMINGRGQTKKPTGDGDHLALAAKALGELWLRALTGEPVGTGDEGAGRTGTGLKQEIERIGHMINNKLNLLLMNDLLFDCLLTIREDSSM